MKRVGVVGSRGYTGQELRRWLPLHPNFELAALDPTSFDGLDGVFVCTPHGASAPIAARALASGCAVVDLSADFRLADAELYQQTYDVAHPHPELLDTAAYGLTEWNRGQIVERRLIANPGCYPTATLLALRPLAEARLAAAHAPLVVDAKSGVSGAGKTPTDQTVFGSVHENTRAYGIGGHRHVPEILQALGDVPLVFVPHVVPMFRGMLITSYLTPADGVTADDMRQCLAERYADEPFVTVQPEGVPATADVAHTNRCAIGVAAAGDHVVVVSVIDNLLKGASGQAIQNMNLVLGVPETRGLPS